MPRKVNIQTANIKRGEAKDLRQEKVAEYMALQYTPRQMYDALVKDGFVKTIPSKSGDVNEPFAIATIRSDIEDLRKAAVERASATVDEHRARQLDEISYIKRIALGEKDTIKGGKLALDAIRLESELTGTKAPIQINIQMISLILKRLELKGIDPNEFWQKMLERLE